VESAIQVGGGQAPHDKTGLEAIIEETLLAEKLGFDVTFVPVHYGARRSTGSRSWPSTSPTPRSCAISASGCCHTCADASFA